MKRFATRSRLQHLLLAAAAACLPSQIVQAVPADLLEYRVKAAFLYNFTKFVEWPAEADGSTSAPLTICVLGRDPFGAALDETVRGKQVNNHPLTVRRLAQLAGSDDCRILFIGDSERGRLREVIRALHGRPVLTVGELPEFTDAQGMIRFLIVEGKVRFIVNQRATDGAGLVLSSKLLSVAQEVVAGPGP